MQPVEDVNLTSPTPSKLLQRGRVETSRFALGPTLADTEPDELAVRTYCYHRPFIGKHRQYSSVFYNCCVIVSSGDARPLRDPLLTNTRHMFQEVIGKSLRLFHKRRG